MLYFSHMNLNRTNLMESTESRSLQKNPQDISVLLDELSPFGLFVSQFLYMASWLFPGNRLPDSIQAAANMLESADISQDKLPPVEKRDHDLP
jgi:hypothetical protein